MKNLLFYMLSIGILTIPYVYPSDWFCTQESSQRVGDEIHTCGVATGIDLNTARTKAFDNAKEEFSKICESSSDCAGRTITLTPMRTECYSLAPEVYRCHRMLAFIVSDAQNVVKGCKGDECPYPKDSPKKIKIGMSKDELLRLYGNPTEVYHILTFEDRKLQYMYSGEYCVMYNCYIVIHDDRVEEVVNFKYQYYEE
jgi:hypothetical protein